MDAASSEDLPRIWDVNVAAAVAAKEGAGNFLNQDEAEDIPPPETSEEMEQKQEDGDNELKYTTAVSAEETPRFKEELKAAAAPPTTQVEASVLIFDKSASTRNYPKKRTRRVGKIPIAKVVKLQEDATASGIACPRDGDDTVVVIENTAAPPREEDTIEGMALEQPSAPVVSTKHDEKWNERFDKLLEYKAKHGNTMVPQCYQDDTRLGRWVHYQRVEYWLHLETGHAKITKERIARLDAIGFEWDPQKAIWNIMYEKLKAVRWKMPNPRSKIGLDFHPSFGLAHFYMYPVLCSSRNKQVIVEFQRDTPRILN
jgi:hypothetical protein